MEKRKRWQLLVILTVLGLTVYNILPTVFFYSKPLNESVGEKRAEQVASAIATRVSEMENSSVNWLKAYSKNLGIKPASIEIQKDDPKLISVNFKKADDAESFRRHLPEAGRIIPFVPAQLQLTAANGDPNTVVVERAVSTHFPKENLNEYFTFGTHSSPIYQQLVDDRLERLEAAAFGTTEAARIINAMQELDVPNDFALALASQIVEYDSAFGPQSGITQRFYAGFGKTAALKTRLEALAKEDPTADRALVILKRDAALFNTPKVKGNPFVESITYDQESDRLLVELYPEVQELRAQGNKQLSQLLLNEMAYIGNRSDEALEPSGGQFAVSLSDLAGSESFLLLNLGAVARQRSELLQQRIQNSWNPTSADFARFPITDYASFKSAPIDQRQLGLVIYAPAASEEKTPEGFRNSSIYVIARGVNQVFEKFRTAGQASVDEATATDMQNLYELLTGSGFLAYSGAAYGLPKEFANDYIFELGDYYGDLLAATREDFQVHGSKRYAMLPFTDVKQRILTQNAIDTAQHEDLLKWRDEYHAARVDMRRASADVPPPTRNVFFDNLKLSTLKYFRGDDRKIIKWGLDLSGGKSVMVALRDQQGRPVTSPDALREGSNELYQRVNKMGVSEVEIRVEGDHIMMNFPGAQGLSASELVKGSTMTFHVVNEKFSYANRDLSGPLSRFLQDVWNEAQVTGKRDVQSINAIAWRQLGEELGSHRSVDAQALYDAGLRLANPDIDPMSNAVDDTLSTITLWRGDTVAEWHNQPNPLLVVFHNYALDGTSLENVNAQYDPQRGNTLTFGVKSSSVTTDGTKIYPSSDLQAWTSQFSASGVAGTGLEQYVNAGKGWRMAVILNGSVISAPELQEALSKNASIYGHFSQREVNQLASDLKAGSLSYMPKVVQERNVSPELGSEERLGGILAAFVGLILVILCMTGYYRFAGMIASIAVFFNLLIMWGVLQNLDAALTLPGIAGIVLTMGMAVDANVLVFERIREEFRATGRIASAIHTGYRKAFTAIIDSNVTTIIAALILLNFDAGPIKAFAVTLIIGIVSSMFTALFMTRYFFAGWVENPNHRELKMFNFFKDTTFNFLSKARVAIAASVLIIAIGMGFLVAQRGSMFGMDFTGGYSLVVNLKEKADTNYRTAAADALVAAGAPSNDVQIRQLNKPNQLRIQLGMGLEQLGRPFFDLPQDLPEGDAIYAFQNNPRIVWTVDALAAAGLEINPDTLSHLSDNWNLMSGQFSNAMRTSAILGLSLALLAILIYITIRFEFKFAISALIALSHDLLITVGIMAILHAIGLRLQIDLQVVGALMTIIGYSLNDTIVVFDRIREDGRLDRKLPYPDLINQSLNLTLNRTLMTSFTTLLVLVALVTLGGRSIFDFSLVMTLGVLVGTFSSLFIASPMLLAFHRREVAKTNRLAA